MIQVLIGADICPIGQNARYFETGDVTALWGDTLLSLLSSADLAIANLECPFILQSSPILKTGPNFGVSPAAMSAIKKSGFHLLSLANNHIMDHGPAGLATTLRVCLESCIQTVGAGENLASARQMFVKKIGSVRIAVLAFAEHEFSIARDGYPGANPLNIPAFVRTVLGNKTQFDYLIVLLHGSHEFHVPTPRIQETCRFMVEMGANAVIVQHPHCLGGYEEYQGGHIVYGQGALLMDEDIYRSSKSFHEGFFVKLSISGPATSSMELIPFTQSDPEPGARAMDPEHEREFLRHLEKRSAAIKDEAFVKEEWLRFCEQHKHGYVSALLGHNRVLRKLNKQGVLTKLLYGKKNLLSVRNIVNCETHREAIQTIFNECLI